MGPENKENVFYTAGIRYFGKNKQCFELFKLLKIINW